MRLCASQCRLDTETSSPTLNGRPTGKLTTIPYVQPMTYSLPVPFKRDFSLNIFCHKFRVRFNQNFVKSCYVTQVLVYHLICHMDLQNS